MLIRRFGEELKIAKRPVECKLVRHSNFEGILKRQINEIFVDWNFESDIGYMILALPSKKADANKTGSSPK